uniref:G_PROTEIN_RECEP_F1_2 domain-containing protein n=1 Tax=Steinernema glaseri TaxID=37863 RepID=A0A1I7YZD3_9BILA
METYVLRRADWEWLYNCSYLSADTWSEVASTWPNTPLGVYSLTFGVIFAPLYMLCLAAMITVKMPNNSCYRIMFVLGIFDVLGLLISCFITGVFLTRGVTFCTSRELIYIIGCVLDGVWAAEGALSVLLALNRCADFWRFRWLKACFDGTGIHYWFIGVVIYTACFVIFPSPPVFSPATHGVWMLDPFADLILNGLQPEVRSNWPLLINNSIVVLALPVLYSALVLSIKFSQSAIGTRKHHMQVALQAFMICLLNFFSAFLYVYMYFLPTHRFLYIVCLVGWQGSSGE